MVPYYLLIPFWLWLPVVATKQGRQGIMGVLDFIKPKEKVMREQEASLGSQIKHVESLIELEKSLKTKKALLVQRRAELLELRNGGADLAETGYSPRKGASSRSSKTTSRTSRTDSKNT